MHTDRNHSWLPAVGKAPWWNLTGFLYLTDVTEDGNPTKLVTVQDSAAIDSPYPVVLPQMDPKLYAAERSATGVRGLTSPTGRMYGTAVPRSKARKQPVSTWDWRSTRRSGLDRLRHPAVPFDRRGVDPFRRGFDAA